MILEISNAEYHAREEISNSQLKLVGTSPAHYKAGFSRIDPNTARIGTAVHSMILEKGKDVICMPENGPKRQSKVDKQWWCDYFKNVLAADIDETSPVAEWFPEIERQTGRTIVTAAEHNEIQAMFDSFKSNELAVELMKYTKPELSLIGEINGIPTRSRPDASCKERIVDLKSCAAASAFEFGRACSKYGYHRQDAFYSLMHHAEYGQWPDFYFIAIEKTAPYSCVVYQLSDQAKENGNYLVERDIELYRQCLETDQWPSFPNNLNLNIPIFEQPEIVDNFEDLVA